MEVEEFLEHHGVKGMKWGIRNDDRVGSSDAAMVVAPLLAIYGGMAVIALIGHGRQSGKFHSVFSRGKQFIHRKKGLPWKVKPELADKKMSANDIMKKVVKPINPGYAKNEYGTKQNCRRATFAYEMRRRGFDVAATNTTTASGGSNNQLYKAVDPNQNKSYKDFASKSKWGQTRTTPERVFTDLAKQPNGARGDISMGWSMGGGHSVAWEIVKGKPIIIDAQSSKMYTNSRQMQKPFNSKNINDIAITRLDNAELNETNLRRWLKDA